ncbi:MAG TPA: RcnB family protein [Rhizomicrobium sp.]|nr:RcnB family protein [Rhizomicrobium sp.]
MTRIAWAALITGIFVASGAPAQTAPAYRLKGPDTCQDQGQQTRPGSAPNTPGRPPRGNPNGPPRPQGGRPQGPVGPAYGHGSAAWTPQRNFDRRAYQRNWNAPRRYNYGAYVRPPGWHYRRWTYGQILPAIFWAQNYWISSWATFGLMAPPYGYQWVRYGNDAILIDTSRGQILQVQYGVFY